jgi:hypothetical protein
MVVRGVLVLIDVDPELVADRDLVLIRSVCFNTLISNEDIFTFDRRSFSGPLRIEAHPGSQLKPGCRRRRVRWANVDSIRWARRPASLAPP